MRSVAAAPAEAPAAADASADTAAAAAAGEAAPEEVEVSYDLLVGADGVDSTVRRILKVGAAGCSRVLRHCGRWRVFLHGAGNDRECTTPSRYFCLPAPQVSHCSRSLV